MAPKRTLFLLAAAGLAAHVASAADLPRFRVEALQAPSGAFTATGLNDLGQVVGHVQPADGEFARSYLWQGGRVQALANRLPHSELHRVGARASALNNSGAIVGSGFTDQHSDMQGAVHWSSPSAAIGSLPHLRGRDGGSATAINEHGTAVGSNHASPGRADEALMWKDGKALTLWSHATGDPRFYVEGPSAMARDINDHDQVVGTVEVPMAEYHGSRWFSRGQAMYWENGQARQLLSDRADWHFTDAAAINNAGLIVGAAEKWTAGDIQSASGWQPAAWIDGKMTFLDSIDGSDADSGSQATDVNNQGWIVGHDGGRAVLWLDGKALAVNSLLDPSAAGWRFSQAIDINDKGQILVQGIDAGGQATFALLTPVPEPASVLLSAGGLLAMAGWRRRRAPALATA
ncbi:DUF3466 family protein [Eleftheria terrae]|uniref:DUF3466 family protein n=1 Tax=Eleftheria terrae TaxID=1597781 RepID=UPI00263BE070|nr:DUF3466 family protein [Eleftheria terrae]WKB51061.1 DUF3466 family protein [Eleftheria terrae]